MTDIAKYCLQTLYGDPAFYMTDLRRANGDTAHLVVVAYEHVDDAFVVDSNGNGLGEFAGMSVIPIYDAPVSDVPRPLYKSQDVLDRLALVLSFVIGFAACFLIVKGGHF